MHWDFLTLLRKNVMCKGFLSSIRNFLGGIAVFVCGLIIYQIIL